MKHSEVVGEIKYDNLVVGPATEGKVVKVAKGTSLKLGALVTIASETATLATSTVGKNYGIVSEAVDAAGGDAYVFVYTGGHFVKKTVAEATGIDITEDIEEACRMDNVLFVDSVE